MKKYVFVLMPFNSQFDDIYKLGIKLACKELDIYCERVDEQYFEGSMLERIYHQIHMADYIVADLSNKNPNVFYEVGYAHALTKKVILITQDGNDIPFDMKHYVHIIYSSNEISKLKDKIYNNLKWYKENDFSGVKNTIGLQAYVNDKMLKEDESDDIEIHVSGDSTNLNISFYNPTGRIYDAKDYEISITLPSYLNIKNFYGFTLPQNMQCENHNYTGFFYPETWIGHKYTIADTKRNETIYGVKHKGQILVSTVSGNTKYPFTFTLQEDN